MMRVVYKDGNTKKEAFLELMIIRSEIGILKGINRLNEYFMCYLSDVLYIIDDPEGPGGV